MQEKLTGNIPIRMTNDYLFKALLQESERTRKAIICSIMHYDPKSVTDVLIKNPIVLGDTIDEKDIILDVNVCLNGGVMIDLEMQVVNHRDWIERSIYYVSRNYANLETGNIYLNVLPSIQIGFLDYTLFTDSPAFHSTYMLMDTKTSRKYSDKFQIKVIDLTQIELATDEDKSYNIDRWARFFKAKTWEELDMIATNDSAMKEAVNTIYNLSENERIRQQCQAREDWERRTGWLIRENERQKNELAETKAELSETKTELSETKAELSETKAELSKKDAEILALKERLRKQETE